MTQAVKAAAPIKTSDPQEWLAGVLRDRFREVVAQRDGSLDPTRTDGIHQMRVAIRRLRSVIRDFAEIVEKFPLMTVRKDLSRLADALGEVRDADVGIESLEKLKEKADDPAIALKIGDFTDRFRDRRARAFENLRPGLSAPSIEKLSMRFEKAVGSALGQPSLFATADFEAAKDEIISNRVDDFLKLSDSLYDPNQIRRLHRLRIAAKHLRYAIELFAATEEERENGPAKEVAKMQSHLGAVHDCDVWIEQFQVGLRLKKQRTLKDADRTAAEWLLSEFVGRRNKAYRKALELWSEWETSHLLETLTSNGYSVVSVPPMPVPAEAP